MKLTDLKIQCLTRVPLDYETVNAFYEQIFGSGFEAIIAVNRLIEMILSHERLRAELEGAEILLEARHRENEKLQANVKLLHDATIVARRSLAIGAPNAEVAIQEIGKILDQVHP